MLRQVSEKLLPSAHAELITELLKDLVRQLKESPEKLPVLDSGGSPIRKPRVSPGPVQSVVYVRPPFVIVSSFSSYNTLSFYPENSLKVAFDLVFQTIVTITSINNNTLCFVVMN